MRPLTLDDIPLSDKNFWTNFIALSFPTALDKETDDSLSEILTDAIGEKVQSLTGWWDCFTKSSASVWEETDGYLPDPTTLVCPLATARTLKVEFHPGDIVYYVDGEQIGCTGPHYRIQVWSFADLTHAATDRRLFLLLLPLVAIGEQEANRAMGIIAQNLEGLFDRLLCERLARSIVYGLTED